MPITTLPTPPARSDDPTTFATKADALLAALPTFVTEVNALGIDSAGASAAAAAASEAAAAASANFVGQWSELVGALNIPASVKHDGRLWLLLSDLADVTASEPGVTADWQVLSSLLGVLTRTSNTILDAADNGSVVVVSGATWTQTLAAASALGNGWSVTIKNTGTANIVVDPDGAETIDGAATLSIKPGESRLVVCDGSNFITVQLDYPAEGLVHLATVVAAGAAEVEFSGLFTSAYDVYVLSAECNNSAATGLLLTFKIGGSYIAADYDAVRNVATLAAATFAGTAGAAGSSIPIISSGSDTGLTMEIFNATSATKPTLITYQTIAGGAGAMKHTVGAGQQDNTGAVEAFKLAPSSGTVTGTFRLYGRSKVND